MSDIIMFRAATRTSAAAAAVTAVWSLRTLLLLPPLPPALGVPPCSVCSCGRRAAALRVDGRECLERLPGRGTGRPIREHSP